MADRLARRGLVWNGSVVYGEAVRAWLDTAS